MSVPAKSISHEAYIASVVEAVKAAAQPEDLEKLEHCRIMYGAGQPGLRGVTFYDRWDRGDGDSIAMVEICAFGEESPVQLAGTTIHELAHVVAGFGAGHGPEWKKACARLGLRAARAAGMNYSMAALRQDIRHLVGHLGGPHDGHPNGYPILGGKPMRPAPKACPMGIGTRGGKSRGKGSGSRLRKWVCGCEKGVSPIVRCAGELNAHCDTCDSKFARAD